MRSAALCAALLTCAGGRAQWSFELDTTFRTSIQDQNVNAIHVLQDGKLFASGRIRYAGDVSVRGSTRLLPSGQRDIAYTGFYGGERILPWTNGKFYVSNGLPRRMMPDGMVDQSFIAPYNGPYFQSSTTGDYHVFPDGRVLISGSHTLSDSIRGYEGNYELIWFSNQGYLDTTRTHRNANGPIWEFKELPDGKFICTCGCTQYEGQPVSKLFRVHADGALDTTFQPNVNAGFIFDYLGLADGRVYVAGRYKRAAAPNDTLFLARFLPDGALDPSFAPPVLSPEWLPNPSTGTLAAHLFPWQGGRLMFTGRFLAVNGSARSGIGMLDSSGTLLDAFDGCGVTPWAYQGFTHVSIEDIEPAGEDTLYICGAYVGFDDCSTNDTLQRFVSRLLVSETTTGVPGSEQATMRLYPNPATSTATLELEHLPLGAELILRDAPGRELLRKTIRNHYSTLFLQNLCDGIYTLELRSGERRIVLQRLVVQH